MRNFLIAFKIFVVMSVLTGVIYPLAVTAVGQAVFPYQANGSLLKKEDQVIGSELIAQKFTHAKYFWPRTSAADYATVASGASNAGPTSESLKKAIAERQAAGAKNEMLYTSGSGLDPEIRPESAYLQLDRVAAERKLSQEQRSLVEKLIQEYTQGPQGGFLGEPRVNVLKLNLALDEKL